MKILHRLAFWDKPELETALQRIGVDCPREPLGMGKYAVVVNIDEADPRWSQIQRVVEDHRTTFSMEWTEFTLSEFNSAAWLEFTADWHNGYPMPSGDAGYRNLTYDLTDYCEKCGVGAKQKAPFRLKGEPRWGTRSIMGINWVFDVVFVKPEVWHAIFGALGIGCRPVLAHRKETELKTVVQLTVDTILDAPLDMGRHAFEVCAYCRRKKYLPFTRGMFPPMTKPVEGVHAVWSKEWFGSGASAHHAVLVSQAVYRAIREHRLKSACFGVVRAVPGNRGTAY